MLKAQKEFTHWPKIIQEILIDVDVLFPKIEVEQFW